MKLVDILRMNVKRKYKNRESRREFNPDDVYRYLDEEISKKLIKLSKKGIRKTEFYLSEIMYGVDQNGKKYSIDNYFSYRWRVYVSWWCQRNGLIYSFLVKIGGSRQTDTDVLVIAW